MTAIDVLRELILKHDFSLQAVEDLLQLVFIARDEARHDWQCAGCGSRACMRVRGGET